MPWAEIYMLGTGGAIPSRERLTSCIAVTDWNGARLLLDAGECCQLRLQRIGLPAPQIDAIMLTHSHGDHVNGLPGLLQSMAVNKRRKPLTIIAPRRLVKFIVETLEVAESRLGFPVTTIAVDDGAKPHTVYTRGGDTLTIKWFRTCHTSDSHGYIIEWSLRPRLRLPPGSSIETARSILRKVKELATTARIVYTGDTAPCETTLKAAQEALVLIHEATFTDDLREEALGRLHSTALAAAVIASVARANLLVLTHVSARYRGYEARLLLEEARKVFRNVILAYDGMRLRVRLPTREVGPSQTRDGPG